MITAPPLTRQTVVEMYRTLAKIEETNTSPIERSGKAAEIEVLQNYLTTLFLQHGNEFIATWLAATDEYQPLVTGLSAIFRRAEAHNKPAPEQVKHVATESRGSLI